ncbi:MAG: hypothetical protein ACD_7C00270G0002 [uncultured bacterium]|nr:MAG: hypothetical protein ACD_7C00270G0002 [uncultured bacterium]HBR79907.1 hypothetical protein [Candidatus Moranbacteria bacterium]
MKELISIGIFWECFKLVSILIIIAVIVGVLLVIVGFYGYFKETHSKCANCGNDESELTYDGSMQCTKCKTLKGFSSLNLPKQGGRLQ